MPRLTKTPNILMTYHDSRSASATRSPLISFTRAKALSSSTDRSRPLEGYRSRSSSPYSITSRTSRSFSYSQRRIWHSSSVQPRLVSCLDWELEARLGEEVSLNSVDLTTITFRTYLSKHMCKGCQPFLPHDDGTFLAVQLPLLGKELPLQLSSH
jgi:hypothetical protein